MSPSEILARAIRRGYRTKIPGRAIPIKQIEEAVSVPIKTVEKPIPVMITAKDPEPPPPKFPSINFIVEIVADFYGITVAQLISAGRTPNLVYPRQVAAYLARTLTPRSFPIIARSLGDRDHTTILHAFNKISVLLHKDERLQAEVEYLTKLVCAPEQSD